jgi:hypothetical protein
MSDAFQAFQLAQFAVSAASTLHQSQVDAKRRQIEIGNANRQASINNKLNYNAHLNLNEQQLLEFKKFGLDDFELKKKIRRERSSSIAISSSFGATFGQQGASREAVNRNIHREGLNAIVRKDFNFKTKLRDFQIRHGNVDLTTLSQNNAAFSNISSGPSAVGTGLQIASAGLTLADNFKKD